MSLSSVLAAERPLARWCAPVCVTFALVGLLASPSLFAQDAVVEDDAAAETTDEGPLGPAPPAEAEALVPIADPAALAILETNPTTPSERVRAIALLFKLEQPAAAKPLAAALLAEKLDDAAWSNLVNEFGPGAFLKLGLEEALAPEGKRISDAALGAAERIALDPQRLAAAVKDLSAPADAVRQTAMVNLRRAGSAAVTPLVAALADPARQAEHDVVRSMLIHLGPVGHPALIPALRSGNPALQSQVADILGRSGGLTATAQLVNGALAERHDPTYREAARQALLRLAGKIPSPPAAADYLYRQAVNTYTGKHPLDLSTDGEAMLWQWNRQSQSSEATRLPIPIARAATAAELARQALELDPALKGAWSLYYAARLETDAYRAGLEKPLPTGPQSAHDLAAKLTPHQLSDLLSDCLRERRVVAATAICDMLGAAGQVAVLTASGTRPAPLVQAAGDENRRVRFAALGAIVKLKPTRPFTGASEVSRGIEYFISSWGRRGAVVAAPRAEEGSRLAGVLAQAGFDPRIAADRQGMFRLASQMSDCELVLIHVLLHSPGAVDALAELRRDPRTAQLPVAIVTPPEHEERARDLVRHDPLAAVWIRPMNRAAVDAQLQMLEDQAAAAGVELELPAARLAQASAALDWLVQLAAAPKSLYDWRQQIPALERALHVPGLAVRAAQVLGELASPQAQRALVELASQETSMPEPRRAAAAAFATSVARFGSLLTTQEMLRQYDRYNDSETKDEATQTLLASLLDALERGRVPTSKGSRDRNKDKKLSTATP